MKNLPTSILKRSLLALVTAAIGLRPAPAKDLHVPVDFATIQAAVKAAASGDVIRIAAGVYMEQVYIQRKSLALIGEPGAVIQAKQGMKSPIPDVGTVPLLAIDRSTNVTLQGLTFDGARLGEAYPEFSYMGVIFFGSSGRVEECIVKGFRTAVDPLFAFNGFGLVAMDSSPPAAIVPNVKAVHNNFADNGLSIHIRGSDSAPSMLHLTFSLDNNTITGVGPTSNGTQAGLLVSYGASGDVTGNRIADYYHTGVGLDFSYGVLAIDWRFFVGAAASPAALLPVRYAGNTFVNNQRNLASVLSHGSQFENNSFQGPASGRSSTGMLITGDTNQITLNGFNDLTRGILLMGDDPDYGTVLGVARNPDLKSNRFCNVTKSLEIEQLVENVSEEGSEVCPFPAPRLALRRLPSGVVQLSWRAAPNEYVLERTDNLATLHWAPAAGLPTAVNDQVTWPGAIGGLYQFFRLRIP